MYDLRRSKGVLIINNINSYLLLTARHLYIISPSHIDPEGGCKETN